MTKRTVLIVEDEPEMRLAIREVLNLLEDVEAIEAGDGIEALESIEKHEPDVVLLDLLMPKMDGFEVLRRLHGGNRDSKPKPAPKVVVMSAFLAPDLVEQVQRLGANRVLTKPFHVDDVLKVVNEMGRDW